MWKRIRFWLKRDSRRMHCRAFCGTCPYYEMCQCDAELTQAFRKQEIKVNEGRGKG